MAISVDLELTNRCNASCHFCPRDQTPHQGLMSPEVFTKSLERSVEMRAGSPPEIEFEVNLCGLGEPLLNKHAPEFVSQVRAEGFVCGMSSNAALLDERRGGALLEAGLQRILVNASETDQDYEDIYKLPFEKTRDNVVRFAEMAKDRCEVYIVLVDHRRDAKHIAKMRDYWKSHGISLFYEYEVMNRGGALFVDHMQFETLPQLARAREMIEERGVAPVCGAPFAYLFIGYDGQYYLCCSDWKKETPMGSVFDESFRSVMERKMQYVSSRDPVCKTCNLDPLNMLTDELRAIDDGVADPDEAATALAKLVDGNGAVHAIVDAFGVEVPEPSARPARRSLPVRAI